MLNVFYIVISLYLTLPSKVLGEVSFYSDDKKLSKTLLPTTKKINSQLLPSSYFNRPITVKVDPADLNPKQSIEEQLILKLAGQLHKNENLGNDPKLLSALGWSVNFNKIKKKWDKIENKYIYRSLSADPKASKKIQFGTAFYYLLTRKNFTCQMPTISRYLIKKFDLQNYTVDECASKLPYIEFDPITQKETIKFLNLDRLHSVQYFYASPTKQPASRFGHSLLRFVFCSQRRTKVSDECLNDFSSHVIVSFRAATGLDSVSMIKGLNGKYPMRMYFMDLDSTMSEYNLNEFRNLESYPLMVTDEEAKSIVRRSIETHWQYSGNYYFTSQNCATETLSLLRSGTLNDKFYRFKSNTPINLKENLLKENLSLTIDESNSSLFIQSSKDDFEMALSMVGEVLKLPKFSTEEFKKLNTEQRLKLVKDLSTLQEAGAFQLVYENYYNSQTAAIISKIMDSYRKGSNNELWHKMVESDQYTSAIITSGMRMSDGIGIPSVEEVNKFKLKNNSDHIAQINAALKENNEFTKQLNELIEENKTIRLELQIKYSLIQVVKKQGDLYE